MGYQNSNTQRPGPTCEVTEHLLDLGNWVSKFDNSQNFKEVNMVSWNGRQPQLDIRNWYIDKISGEKKAGKGVGLNDTEATALLKVLQTRYSQQ